MFAAPAKQPALGAIARYATRMMRSAAASLLVLVVACSGDPIASGSHESKSADAGATVTDSGGSSSDDGGTGGGDDAGSNADSGTGADAAPPPSSAAQDCVDAINGYRKSLGLAPYARWSSAESCADGQAKSDSQSQQAHGAFGACGESAQNECPGWPGPPAPMIVDCLKAMWGEGPGGGHYENMRSAEYTQVACGFYTTSDGSVWAVQDFQ